MSELKLTTADGCTLAATLHEANEPNGDVVIINAAMAVPRQFYSAFANFLSEHGYDTLTYDYRGIGDSTQQPLPPGQLLIRDWGLQDFEAALQWAQQRKPRQLIVFGHSAGGQIVGLAPSALNIDVLILTASQSGYWRHWQGLGKLGMFALWYAVIPLLANGNHFPAHLIGLADGKVPSGIIRNWARWGRSSDYLFDPRHGYDLSRYRQLEIPMLVYNFKDDSYAPSRAVDALQRQYTAAQIERQQIDPATYGEKTIGHFGFYRSRLKGSLWQDTLHWLRQHNTIRV